MSLGRRRVSAYRVVCLALGVLLLAGSTALYLRLRPTIIALATAEARIFAVSAISDVVYERLAAEQAEYGSFVELRYNSAGAVASLQTDIVGLGTLQAEMTESLVKSISSFRNQTVSVPLGNILGGYWFSGRGPSVDFRLIPANTVETQVINKFDGAGLNQTRHQILLKVRLGVTAISAGYHAETDIETNVVLAETVIVGAVPESYTKVYEATDSLTGAINDYSAENYIDD